MKSKSKNKLKLVVISSAPIVQMSGKNFLYAPYHKEMKIWAKYANEIQFCCPIWREDKGLLIDEISFPISNTIELKEFNIKSITKIPLAIYYSVVNFCIILKAIHSADHLHLRCPGNIGLLGSIAQLLYPKKNKTVKYAGNWDPKSKQPWSYRLQKWFLSNTFLTKNMKVLVYGEWPNQTQNIKPFFTATYAESDKKEVKVRNLSGRVRFLFVGMLSEGKQPLYVAGILQQLILKGFDVQLDYYGDGKMREALEKFCLDNNLNDNIFLQGNQPKNKVEDAYRESHFLVLPSKSEGWPKVVAEAMFWGCIPIATPVSCVPYMLDYGKRGVLLTNEMDGDVNAIVALLKEPEKFTEKAKEGQLWSRQFTTDAFEAEISKLVK